LTRGGYLVRVVTILLHEVAHPNPNRYQPMGAEHCLCH